MPFRTIAPREAAALLASGRTDLVLLDCRQPEELAIVKVAGSLDIPMREIPKRVGTLDRSKEYLVLCHHGTRSTQVGLFLERSGFDRVASVDGGIEAWAADVDPTLPHY